MSVPLHTHGTAVSLTSAVIGCVARAPRPQHDRHDWIRVLDGSEVGEDLSGYLAVATTGAASDCPTPVVHSVQRADHLEEGDVVRLAPNGYVRTLFRVASPHNALFATDRCNSYCLMCSQPPKPTERDPLEEHLRLLDLIPPTTPELGITGGEPTLLKAALLTLVARARERLPTTALHVLSNGRLFCYEAFARDLAAIDHPDLMIGVPLYSDLDYLHDHVVQAKGAFGQTMVGLQNLGRHGVPVEIRVVLHALTVDRLPALAEFIYRNLTFAAQVVFMGLEPMGFAVPNLGALWIESADYADRLRTATIYLAHRGMRVSLYNLQLCVLPPELWRYARRSISDWKNDYLPVCDACAVRNECAGFFTSSLLRRIPAGIHPISAEA